jgi:pimeloyl-ACP methyl ester carboxylesterase
VRLWPTLCSRCTTFFCSSNHLRTYELELTKNLQLDAPGRPLWAALRTDEARLVDLVKFGQGDRFSLEHLWGEFSQLDLTPSRSFAVPLFFLLGRHDWQVPATLAAQYFATIDAPCKRLIWFEQSAHHPPFEEPETFHAVLIDQVLPVVQAPTRTCPAQAAAGVRRPDTRVPAQARA